MTGVIESVVIECVVIESVVIESVVSDFDMLSVCQHATAPTGGQPSCGDGPACCRPWPCG